MAGRTDPVLMMITHRNASPNFSPKSVLKIQMASVSSRSPFFLTLSVCATLTCGGCLTRSGLLTCFLLANIFTRSPMKVDVNKNGYLEIDEVIDALESSGLSASRFGQ